MRKDGSRLPVELTVTAVRGVDGQPTGFIGIARDVTVEKQALAEIRAAERRWRALLDHLPEASVLVIDSELRFRVAAGAGLQRQGLGDAAGRTLFEVSSPRNVEVLEPLIRRALAGREGSSELSSSNVGLTNEVDVVPLPAEGGDPEVLVVARDVSVARNRERLLAETEERFRRLFDEAPNGIAVLDSRGTILQINRAMSLLVGRAADVLKGRPAGALDGSPRASFVRRTMAAHRSSDGGRITAEGRVRHSAGHEVDVSVDMLTLPGGAGDRQILVNMVDVSERRRNEEQLAYLADHDPLTGLENRRRLDAELKSHLARCARYGARGALMMLDLDHFKQINDTLGHRAGDQLITFTAQLLRARLRASDVVARLGGDEFAILLPEADIASARKVAADIVAAIRENATMLDGGHVRRLTTSVGVVMIDRTGVSASELLSWADLSMYESKDGGRDRYSLLGTSRCDQKRTIARLT